MSVNEEIRIIVFNKIQSMASCRIQNKRDANEEFGNKNRVKVIRKHNIRRIFIDLNIATRFIFHQFQHSAHTLSEKEKARMLCRVGAWFSSVSHFLLS